MSASPPASTGFMGALRTLGDGLFAGAQQRIELLSVELQEEKFRLIQIFIWIGAVIFTGAMAVLLASLTVVYLFWESARLAVLGGLTAFYALTLLILVLAFRRYLAGQPKPFAATLQEIGADRTCIRTGN